MRATPIRYCFSGKKTPLYDFHLAHKGKMVEFAGYSMPVHYPQGIIKEHLHCRSKASIFDVSHMGQIVLSGADRLNLLQRTTVGRTQRRSKNGINQCYLTLFLNKEAGIIDDAIVTNIQEEGIVRIVANAGNKYQVVKHLMQVSKQELYDVKINLNESLALIALQGPAAAQTLQNFLQDIDLKSVPFMSSFHAKIDGKEFIISRSGYTGEDGFQISGPDSQVITLVQKLKQNQNVDLAGLGARDSLRIEAGLCLHGHQISPSITPFEANLMWTVHKHQAHDNRLSFIGEEALKHQVEDNKAGIKKHRKRVGFMLVGPGIVRQNCRIYNENDQEVGITTSGTHSPVFKKGLGMAYLDKNYIKLGTKLYAEQRDKKYGLEVTKMPFVPTGYYSSWDKIFGS